MAFWVDKAMSFSTKKCLICNEGDDELNLGILHNLNVFSVHYLCVRTGYHLHASGSSLEKDGLFGYLLGDIYSGYRRYLDILCEYCKKPGASLQCNLCKTKYHLPCGLRNGNMVQMRGGFDSYCDYCYSRLFPVVTCDRKRHTCPFCNFPPDKRDRLYRPRCCKPSNYIMDLNCLKRYAQVACNEVKCPLCSDTRKFNRSIAKFGVFIPDVDSERLREQPHAFISFPLRCCARVCNIKADNKMSTIIVACIICDQKIAHMECTFFRIFLCMDCSATCFPNFPKIALNPSNFDIDNLFPWFYPLIQSIKYGKHLRRIVRKIIAILKKNLDEEAVTVPWYRILDIEDSYFIAMKIEGHYKKILNKENKENKPEQVERPSKRRKY